MKKICITFLCCCIIVLVALSGCNTSNYEYLRIHVRANSNSTVDQTVKYLVRDEVCNYLTPLVAHCKDKNSAVNVINNNKDKLKLLIDDLLMRKGFDYESNIVIKNEQFPTRTYKDLTLESGYYDAVIVQLGKAQGDNWWCVVYPPLCFTNNENVVYRSKIHDIIDFYLK